MTSCDVKIINRLRRAEGQLRGVAKMIEEEKACVDVITQLSAVRSSVDRIMGVIVAENLRTCLEDHEGDEAAKKEKIAEAIRLIERK